MVNLSYETMFQWAFALSPFPSYIPQYISIMQMASSDDIRVTAPLRKQEVTIIVVLEQHLQLIIIEEGNIICVKGIIII